jgi:hypothetical protein
MLIACWITKTTNTHSGCVILFAFPLQQWLHERASLLRYAHIACLVYYVYQGSSSLRDRISSAEATFAATGLKYVGEMETVVTRW